MKLQTIFFLAAGSLLFGGEFTPYQKALILKENGRVLNVEMLKPDTPYFFSYPYKGTPAMLIRAELKDENNVSSYQLFSYLAVNPSSYEYANNDVSIVAYYKEDPFGDEVIRFCDDKSSYAIRNGANLLDTNETRHNPLVSVRLEEANGKLYAVGLEDGEVLKTYFQLQREKLIKRFRSLWNAKIKESKPRAYIDEQFSLVTVRCNDKLPPKPIALDQNLTGEGNATDEKVILELIDTVSE